MQFLCAIVKFGKPQRTTASKRKFNKINVIKLLFCCYTFSQIFSGLTPALPMSFIHLSPNCFFENNNGLRHCSNTVCGNLFLLM